MIDLFKSRGMSHDDATEVIHRMSKYKTFFINLMMTEELALPVRHAHTPADALCSSGWRETPCPRGHLGPPLRVHVLLLLP